MPINRRLFLTFMGSFALVRCAGITDINEEFIFTAGLRENKKYFVYFGKMKDLSYFTIELPFEVHSVVQNILNKNEVIVIEKRGAHFAHIDFIKRKIISIFKLPEEREFVGHGLINPITKKLIITTRKVTKEVYHQKENGAYQPMHAISGIENNGLLSFFVYKHSQWVFEKEIYSGVAEPHQLIFNEKDNTFWVANGLDQTKEMLKSRFACLTQFDGQKSTLLANYDFKPDEKGYIADLGHLSIASNGNIILGAYVYYKDKSKNSGGRMISFNKTLSEFNIYTGKEMPLKDEAFNITYLKGENKFLAVCPGEDKIFKINADTLKVEKIVKLKNGLEPGGLISTKIKGEYFWLNNKGGLIINNNLQIIKSFKLDKNYFPSPHLELLKV